MQLSSSICSTPCSSISFFISDAVFSLKRLWIINLPSTPSTSWSYCFWLGIEVEGESSVLVIVFVTLWRGTAFDGFPVFILSMTWLIVYISGILYIIVSLVSCYFVCRRVTRYGSWDNFEIVEVFLTATDYFFF